MGVAGVVGGRTGKNTMSFNIGMNSIVINNANLSDMAMAGVVVGLYL